MFAPGESYHKENPNPPHVTFRRIHGRIVPIVAGKQPRGATKILRDELKTREAEVSQAERGMRGVGKNEHGEAVKNFGTKSTFPKYFGELGFNSKKQFLDVLNKQKGKKFEAVVNDSIHGLLHGRQSAWGFLPPNKAFRLATKQEFDNRNVIFRNIEGRVVPLKMKAMEEVPF